MIKQICMVGLVAATFAAPAAFAGSMPAGSISGYLTNEELDGGSGSIDGTGFGIRGWASVNGPWFVHGEYQTATLEASGGFEADVDQLRLGGGFAGEVQKGMMWIAKGEYISIGGDVDPKQGGFGVHGGLIIMASDALGFFGTLGYLTTDDTDGLEFDIGGKFSFTKEWALAIDYRAYMGSVDPSGDFDLTDLRIGASYSFY